MADACPNHELIAAPIEARIAELERQLLAQRRTNEVLLTRIAKSVDIEGGAFSLHERNTLLQQSVDARNRELEEMNRHLRQEIAERRMVEQALRFSEERYRFLMEESQQPLVVVRDFEFIYANPAAARLFGYATAQDLISAGIEAVIPDNELAQRKFGFERRIAGEEPEQRYERRFKRSDGRIVWCEINARVGEFEGAVALLTSLHDITERKQAAAELARSNSVLRATLESTADGILVVDDAGMVNTFNEKFISMWSVPSKLKAADGDLLEHMLAQLTDPDGFMRQIRDLNSDPEARSFDLLRFKDGRVFERSSQPQRIGGACVGRVWSFRDITDRLNAEETRRELEAQLRQAQKMEAIGTLAGGIAHDFNNILYAIQGYAELVRDSLPEGSLARKDQDEVLIASRRAADLVRQILAFSRRSSAQAVPVDIALTAQEVMRLVCASLPATIDLVLKNDCRSAVVMADPTHIHQILMNLCTNAGHAMGEKPGLLEISLRSEIVTPTAARDMGGRQAGSYIVLGVSDNGSGIPPEALERIFDPFFTTKEVGVGTGLGLSTVHGIVVSLGGEIKVISEQGRGTLFEIYLPQAEAEVQLVGVDTSAPLTGNERLMFVEDEEPLARMCSEGLSRLGYKVEVFTSSAKALERFQAAPLDFDLIVTDQTMPKLSGTDLARQVLALRPGLPVIICSGYTEAVTPETAKEMGIYALLGKPLAMKDLASAIRGALSAAVPAESSRSQSA